MHEDPQSRVLHTAVGQVLSFCLLAMKPQQRSKEWQARAYRLLEKWPVSRVFHETPQSERVATPPVSEFKMRLRLLTPRSFGLRRRSGGKITCAEGDVMSSDDDSSEDSQDMHTPSKAGRGSPKHGSSVSATSTVSPDLSRTRTQSQQYYTQACNYRDTRSRCEICIIWMNVASKWAIIKKSKWYSIAELVVLSR